MSVQNYIIFLADKIFLSTFIIYFFFARPFGHFLNFSHWK